MPAHIPPDGCGVLTAGMVWSKPPGIPTRASAPVFPGQPLRLYTGPSPPGCGNFFFPPLRYSGRMLDVRPPLCANPGPDAALRTTDDNDIPLKFYDIVDEYGPSGCAGKG